MTYSRKAPASRTAPPRTAKAVGAVRTWGHDKALLRVRRGQFRLLGRQPGWALSHRCMAAVVTGPQTPSTETRRRCCQALTAAVVFR
jgi:hypothetical protein